MMKKRINTGIYIDAENVGGTLDLKETFSRLILSDAIEYDHKAEMAFVIKCVYGRAESLKNIGKSYAAYNFEIKETPSVGLKNRADLIISIDAFDALYIGNPKIERFIFATNDSDFTTIMDRLRKYGAEVWLVTTKTEELKDIFNNSCDKIIYTNRNSPETNHAKAIESAQSEDTELKKKLRTVLESLDRGKPHLASYIGHKLHEMDRSLDFSTTKYRGLESFLKTIANEMKFVASKNEKGYLEISFPQQ
jgi:hypothetical protein